MHRAREIAAAWEALGRADFASLVTLGHNLHGSGSSFGFPRLSALGRRIEAAAQACDASRLAELLARLASAVSDAVGADVLRANPLRGLGASRYGMRRHLVRNK